METVALPQTHTPSHQDDTPSTTTQSSQQAEVVILIDSGSLLMRRSFSQDIEQIKCQNTKKALGLLSEEHIGRPTHIIIHTGTNDLRMQQEKVATSIRAVIEKASTTFP
ncbi:hypothetical protein JOB18_040438 [Solea senegalensis]|uniref:Uncharacterized protein n=1 Tax=Solea senegalensis TaxID=28829 RepID=A0AAV6T1C3_SOLSE|nr:hypothetical protein JOB18_040438 [Solea senegalensis]